MSLRHWFVNGHIIDENGTGEIAQFAKGEKGDKEDAPLFSLFLRAISVCHTVVPAVDEKTNSAGFVEDISLISNTHPNNPLSLSSDLL